jgi:hypothetical protein
VTDIEAWEQLYDALLHASADGDVAAAAAGLEGLARGLSDDDPLRGEVLFRLGDARYALGDADRAREALRDCIRFTSPSRPKCLDRLWRIEVDEGRIGHIPARFEFGDGVQPFVRPTTGNVDRGSLRVDDESPGGDPALLWTVGNDPVEDLVVGFRDPSPAPRGVRVLARTNEADVRLRVVAIDSNGRRYATPGILPVPQDGWGPIDVALDTLEAEDPGAGRLVPSRLDAVILEDATSPSRRVTGTAIWLDDVELY